MALHQKSDRNLNSLSLKNNQPRIENCPTKIKILKEEWFGFYPVRPRAELEETSAVNVQHLTICVFWTFHIPPNCYGRRTERVGVGPPESPLVTLGADGCVT